jgi:hypothetical protein
LSKLVAVVHVNSLVPVLLSLVIRPAAITVGRHIFVRRGVAATDGLLRHEMAHVLQFAELGLVGFAWFYACDFVRALWRLRDRAESYRAIRLEQEARALEKRGDVAWRELGGVRQAGAWRQLELLGERG